MRKSKKTIAILAVIAMVLMMIPVQAFAADNSSATGRLSGADRVQTAISIANSGWANGTSNVVVVPANDQNLVDALAVAPLAKQLNAPILLTDKAGLDASVSAEIATLKATNVYAVGALSDAVANQLKALSGVTVTQIKGADRFDTAAQIAAKLTKPAGSFVVGYNGLPDALSAASYAAANGYAILVANTDGTVPANEAAYEGSKVIELGGPTLVADIAGATRYYGADRYATNDQIIKNLSFKYDKVFVANGETLVDALSGAVLAAQSNSPIVLANTQGAAAAADVNKNMNSGSQVIAFGGTAVVPDSVVTAIQTGNTTPATVSVQSVKAVSANTIQIKFSSAPADTSKVSFSVLSNTTPVSLTTSWDSTKTVATLTASANLPAGTYTVDVKNAAADLGTSTVTISAQAIAKINITSTKLAVNSSGIGYATYQVLDQYGNDITNSYLAKNIQFQTGVGTVTTPSNGLLVVTPAANMNLIQFSTIVITAFDQTSGVSTTATLTTSTALGTLQTITLNKLTSPTNAVLTAGDTSDVWYVDYSATDMSGNPTKAYNLVKGGLILGNNANGNGNALTTSSPYVLANLIQDPNDSNSAAIQVKVTGDSIPTDLPVTISAMGYSGTTSTLNLTLKKASATDSFTLMAPAYNIASGEYKQIPFTAYDQNGTQLTKYSDLNGTVTLSGGATLVQNVDGTASVYVQAITNNGSQPISQIITAVTPTGKLSTLTLSIQPAAVANTLSLDSSVLVNAMQEGAVQNVDFGYKYGGFSVTDQYGRTIDMTGKPGNYEVTTTVTGAVTATGAAYGSNPITITSGNTAGQGTVTFNLIDKTNPSVVIDSKTVTFSVLQNSDIKGYTMDTVPNPLYAGANLGHASAAFTGRENAYDANPYVYGTTSSGAKVILAGKPVIGAYVDNTTNFAIDNSPSAESFPADYEGVYVAAGTLPSTQTTATATLTVTLMGADGAVHSLTTPVSSSSTAPVAKSVVASVATWVNGISLNSAGDTATTSLAADPFAVGESLARFDNNGSNANRAKVYFYAKDSYGTKAMQLSQFVVVASGTKLASGDSFTVDQNGNITASHLTAGDYVTVSAVANNGLVQTLRINFVQ